MNLLVFNVVVTAIIILLTWFLNDILPQIRYNRKLDRTAKLAEESRQRYLEARANEVTTEIRVPAWTEGRYS